MLIPSYGALAAAGVVAALMLAQRAARTTGVSRSQIWDVCVIGLLCTLVGSRLLLVAVNWRDLRAHPLWMLGLATMHSPLLAGGAAILGAIPALVYMRWQRMPPLTTLDTLALPFMIGLTFEQLGALLAGAGYGTETKVPWAVVYTHPLAEKWSGTPLGVPLHPVQAYAALAYFTLAASLWILLPARRQPGDIAGLALLGLGLAVYVTEFWRDPEGRGQVLNGMLDGPQVGAIVLVLAGALLLRERRGPGPGSAIGVAHG